MADQAPALHTRPTDTQVASSALSAFAAHCGRAWGHELRRWAARHPGAFWSQLTRWAGVLHSGSLEPALEGQGVESARFFPQLSLSYTENLLAGAALCSPDAPALSGYDETGHLETLTWSQLERRVVATAAGLRALGVEPGHSVGAVARNSVEAAVACLAVTGLGASWCSVAPDMGLEATLGRFSRLRPRWLLAHEGHRHGGQVHSLRPLLGALVEALEPQALLWLERAQPLEGARCLELAALEVTPPSWSWPHFPFDHELFVLFSSGTTGEPKGIVHGAGGALLTHLREHRLHANLQPGDALYFHTTCGWMMWNWALSALASGVRLVVYDGSISHPGPEALVRLVEQAQVTHWGTSPVYLQFLEESGVRPSEIAALPRLRRVLSTGSVLPPRAWRFVRAQIKEVPLDSISGGTDILGCFVMGDPNSPVYEGESASTTLGMDVRVARGGDFFEEGEGELVCCSPFPSRPVRLLGDPQGEALHRAWFSQHPGAWTHGDRLLLTARGSARILGRSDGVLNIKGVRMGPGELESALSDLEAIHQVLAVALPEERALGGLSLLLLVVLAPGYRWERKLLWDIKRQIKQRRSAHHVPQHVVEVPALPMTWSGKVSGRAVRDLLRGLPPGNLEALRNPEALEQLREALRSALGWTPPR